MKILSPIGSSKDIDILDPLKYDTEFFCGFLPDWWFQKYNKGVVEKDVKILSTPLNNRNDIKANIRSKKEMREIVRLVKEKNTKLFLVLNAKYYPDYVYNDLKKYLREIYELGIRHVICCDLGIIKLIEQYFPEIKVSVSCLNQVSNSSEIDFYMQFSNIDRIVFPRHMSSKEISKISKKYTNLEFEYFVFSNKCLYDDGYCRGLHAFDPICKASFYSKFYDLNTNQEVHDMTTLAEKFWDWTQNEKNALKKGYCTLNFACSACSLIKLVKLKNISSVKISIRGHDIEERLKQVKMARLAIDCAENNDLEGIKKSICKIYGKEDLCEKGMSCMMK